MVAHSQCDLTVAVEAFIDTDKKYLQTPLGGNRDDGCTAVTAVLVGQKLIVANVGDSRAVLSRGGKGRSALDQAGQAGKAECLYGDIGFKFQFMLVCVMNWVARFMKDSNLNTISARMLERDACPSVCHSGSGG